MTEVILSSRDLFRSEGGRHLGSLGGFVHLKMLRERYSIMPMENCNESPITEEQEMSSAAHINDLLRDDVRLERVSIRYVNDSGQRIDVWKQVEDDEVEGIEIVWRCREKDRESWFDRSFTIRRDGQSSYSLFSSASEFIYMLREAHAHGERFRAKAITELLS